MSFAVLFSLTVLSILHRVASLPSTPGTSGQIAAAWYTSWHASGVKAFPDTAIPWKKYNTVIYSFAVTAPDVNTLSLSGSDASLSDFVSRAHENNVAAHVGIGGWGGSIYFSSNVATPENRTAFVKTVANFANKFGLNGIEFDWEFPYKQGIGCNILDADDTQNFLKFLQELRRDPVGAKLTLTAAVSIAPFNDASGNPSKDVSGFAKVLDYIVIMDYDIWGKWSSSVGPNSPLDDTCATDPANRAGSAVSAVKAWTAAGIRVNQIVLGVPSYGHSFSVSPSDAFVDDSQTKLAPNPKFDASKQPLGDAWSNTGGTDACGVEEGPGGTFELWGLVDGGFLATDGNPAQDIYYRYDDCSQTPYVYNKTSQVMVSFDNADSFAAKGKYIKATNLRGFSMWEAGGDYNDILLNSIRTAAGFGGVDDWHYHNLVLEDQNTDGKCNLKWVKEELAEGIKLQANQTTGDDSEAVASIVWWPESPDQLVVAWDLPDRRPPAESCEVSSSDMTCPPMLDNQDYLVTSILTRILYLRAVREAWHRTTSGPVAEPPVWEGLSVADCVRGETHENEEWSGTGRVLRERLLQ